MKYISISDIHLAHRRTPTTHIIKNLIKYVFNDRNKDVDVIFFGGDLYDRLIDAGSKDNLEIITFLGNMLEYCSKYDIAVRVLEGTPSHDWMQQRVLLRLNDLRDKPVDLKYFDILDIDYMEKFDKYVLYIPDEWSRNHEEIERQIEAKMREKGISQVDIAILHSVFTYQMAGIPYHGFTYNEEYFLKLVKEYIHIGHFHTHSNLDRIIAGGSFDRLAHGEEDAKGYIIVENGDWRFIPNEDAYIYKTIPITKKDTLNDLDRKISKYPVGSYIRLSLASDHPFNLNFKDIVIRYRDYVITSITTKDTGNSVVTDIINDDYDLVGFDFLTTDLKTLVRSNVIAKHDLNENEILKLDECLKVFKDTEVKQEE